MPIGAVITVLALFIGLPWLILHYVTKWKQAPRITDEDEKLLDEMHMLARRLEERLNTVERIVAADNPDFKPSLGAEWKPSLSAPQSEYRPEYRIDRRN
jgi:phage shock protein B